MKKMLFLALCLLAHPMQAHATEPRLNCSTADVTEQAMLLDGYIKKSVTDDESYSVAGIGNHAYLFNHKMDPVLPEDLAALLKNDPKVKRAKRIVLAWPYSTWGNADYARTLEKRLGKPVVGFSGPVWWYPDGSAIASNPKLSRSEGPDETNVAECLNRLGKYYSGRECKALVANQSGKPIFANIAFVLNCEQVNTLAVKAQANDAAANFRLYLHNFFVNIDTRQAPEYLARAAMAGHPLASYLTARSMLSQTPPEMDLYRQFLTIAAEGGMEKAKEDLAKLAPKH